MKLNLSTIKEAGKIFESGDVIGNTELSEDFNVKLIYTKAIQCADMVGGIDFNTVHIVEDSKYPELKEISIEDLPKDITEKDLYEWINNLLIFNSSVYVEDCEKYYLLGVNAMVNEFGEIIVE